jgi:hypothetical protein
MEAAVFAYDYPLLDVFVTILFLMLFVVWLFLLFHVIADLFRDPDQGGAGKAMWLLFLFVLPYIGVLTYIAIHGSAMSVRAMERGRRKAAQIAF